MPIQFSISLSMNQIACLKAVQMLNDGDTQVRDFPRAWFMGSRLLLAEGYITWQDRGFAKTQEEVEERFRHSHQITEKGRLLLRLIELEVQDFQQQLLTASQNMVNVVRAENDTTERMAVYGPVSQRRKRRVTVAPKEPETPTE